MGHPRPRLSVFSRQLLVAQVAAEPRPNRSRIAAESRLGVILRHVPGWVAHYNTECTHIALHVVTPMEARINHLHGNHC